MMTEAEIRKIAHEAARQAVKETLISLGVDADDPLEYQRDMQHLRSWRQASETVKRQSIITAVGIIIAGTIGAVWVFVKGS